MRRRGKEYRATDAVVGKGKVRETPSFSVVIPLYNKGPHIDAAVRSAIGQTVTPREILIVDDGSTDDGLEQCHRMRDPRIRTFSRPSPGPGGYAARNLAIRQAGCEWIAFLDADDRWRPNHLENLWSAIDAAGGDVGCAFARLEARADGKLRPYAIPRFLVDLADQPLEWETVVRAWLETGRCPLWTGAIAVRRDVLIGAGLFPEGLARRGGDKDTWLRVLMRTRSVLARDITAEFNLDAGNRLSNSTAHTAVPIVSDTIRAILPTAEGEQRRLLRALSNQEVALYARWSAARGIAVGRAFLKRIYMPEGWRAYATVLAMMAAARIVRLLRRG